MGQFFCPLLPSLPVIVRRIHFLVSFTDVEQRETSFRTKLQDSSNRKSRYLICGERMLHCRIGKASQAILSNARRLSTKGISNRLFVGGLSFDTNETILRDVFGEHGEIIEVKVICDRWSGNSKGFGFIQFASENEATRALQYMDGQSLEGRNIRVQFYSKKS